MEYRQLGKTGLQVSTLGFGCGNVGGLMVRGSHQDRVRAVRRAMEAGINYFDTAPSYGNGQSERHLGEVLRELNADVYVGTKVRLSPDELSDLRGAIIGSVEASLQRMGRDSVDLIQLHNRVSHRRQPNLQERSDGDSTVSVEDVLGEVVDTFQRLQREGKVRFYGMTALGDTSALLEVLASGALYTAQVCYNLLNPSAGQPVPAGFPNQDYGGLIDHAVRHGVGCIGIRVLAAGALSGVEERHPVAVPTVAPIGTGPDYRADVRLAQRLSFLAREGFAESLVEGAMRFAWTHPGISTALVGCSSLDHLELAIAAAARGGLPSEALGRVTQAWEDFAARH